MATLSPADFAAKWTPLLADNVFMEIDGPRLAQFVADLTDSFAASVATANVPDWLAGTYYPLGFVILHAFGSGPAIFLKALAADYLPVPTAAAGDANWEPVLSPAADNALYQVGTVDALRHAQNFWVPGRLYILINRLDAKGQPLYDVYVRAVTASQLEPEGYVLDPKALGMAPVRVRYQLDTDMVAPVQQLDLSGILATQQEHTQQLAELGSNVLYRAGQEIVLATDDDLNSLVQDGDEVHLRRLVQLNLLQLKSATYYTHGLPHRLETITDAGQSVQAKVLGGMSPRADARRTVSLSGAGTQLILEADLHLVSNTGNSVTLASSAELRHTGLLSGYGSSALGALLANTARYYHQGRSTFGGSVGLKMSGTAYAEMRETQPAVYNFRPAIILSEQAQADWYGGLHLEPGTANAGSQLAQLNDNSALRLRSGRYDNASATAFALQNTATLEVSSAVTVEAPAGLAYGPPNTNLLRHAGGQLNGSLSGGIVLTEVASDLPSTGGTAYVGGEGIEVNGNVIRASGFGGLRADLSADAGGAVAWDAGGRYQDFRSLRLDDNATLQLPTNVPAGGSGFLRVFQGGSGGKTLAAPAGSMSQVPASFGVNSTPNALVALVGYVFDGTNFYWNVTRYN